MSPSIFVMAAVIGVRILAKGLSDWRREYAARMAAYQHSRVQELLTRTRRGMTA